MLDATHDFLLGKRAGFAVLLMLNPLPAALPGEKLEYGNKLFWSTVGLLSCGFSILCWRSTNRRAVSAASGQGGFMGFLVGCCFGIRSGAAYNDGKDLHWREWAQIIPIAGLVVAIMNGVDGMGGITTSELAAQYGSTYY